jgi:uncharacterized protein YdeI (YjbR/CyaY-like superfamily)
MTQRKNISQPPDFWDVVDRAAIERNAFLGLNMERKRQPRTKVAKKKKTRPKRI